MRDQLKDGQTHQRRNPKQKIKEKGPKKLGQDDIPVQHRSREQHFNRSGLIFLGKKPHGQDRHKNDQQKPKMKNIEVNLHHRELLHPLPQISHTLAETKSIDQRHAGHQHPRNGRMKDRSNFPFPKNPEGSGHGLILG